MKHIFLDFDRTLFDTDRFYNALEYQMFIADPVKHSLNLADFLYNDVIPFLKLATDNDWKCYLVTFGVRGIQESKFLSCGLEKYFADMFYVESGSKAEIILKATNNLVSHENIVFIDDAIEHLEGLSQLAPKTKTIRMTRPEAKGSEVYDSRFTTISRLEQVLPIISN